MSQSIPINRVQSEGAVYRWEQTNPGWPGHLSFIAVEGIEVIVGDRFEKGHRQTYSCHPQAFLDGCFHDTIKDRYGAKVLNEVIASVKARGFGLDVLESLPKAELLWKDKPLIQAWPTPKTIFTTPAAASSKPVANAPALSNAAHVNLVVPAGERVDMARFLALKTTTGLSADELRRRLNASPAVILPNTPREKATKIQSRLQTLGLTLSLLGHNGTTTTTKSAPKPTQPSPARKTVKVRRAKPKNYQLVVTRMPNRKAPVIKAISASITHSKKKATMLVHRLPAKILIGASEEEAVMIKSKLEAVGAVVKMSQIS